MGRPALFPPIIPISSLQRTLRQGEKAMRKDKGHYKEKYPADRKLDDNVAEAVRKKAQKGDLTCAIAFNIAEAAKVSPAEIGFAMDRLEIPIKKCQLGLFGYSPISRIIQKAETVSVELERAIREAVTDGRLSCDASWKIAKEFKMAKIRVSAACEKLGIKISHCQLGAF
jgi:hypothetical protein